MFVSVPFYTLPISLWSWSWVSSTFFINSQMSAEILSKIWIVAWSLDWVNLGMFFLMILKVFSRNFSDGVEDMFLFTINVFNYIFSCSWCKLCTFKLLVGYFSCSKYLSWCKFGFIWWLFRVYNKNTFLMI